MQQHLSEKRRCRMAVRIRDRLTALSRPVPLVLPEFEWRRVVRGVDRLAMATSRGWEAARRALHRDFLLDVRSLTRHLDGMLSPPDPGQTLAPVPTLRDLCDDLIALEQEFGGITLDLKLGQVSVVTDPIELEGVDLGPFQVTLSIDQIGARQPYAVVPFEGGNPARGHSDTPHPHVQDETLCEGEGRASILAALQTGRLFDFFLLVRQVLQTYNAGSAYVPLEAWEGRECQDCGQRTSHETASYCGRCDHDLCDDCAPACGDCGRTVCSLCRGRCAGCDEVVCEPCTVSCRTCRDSFCSGCLTRGQCPACSPTEDVPDETPPAESNASPDGPLSALHALCLGQTPVPA